MKIKTFDRNNFSFGRISDPGVLGRSPLYRQNPDIEAFSSQNFQYVVNHIADIFGYAHNVISVSVEENDYMSGWSDLNRNNKIDEGELSLQFTMNASINIYERTSVYGKHFMYINAKQYGTPLIWGIAAHEVGHLVADHALNTLESQVVNGRPALVLTQTIQNYWSELCADYLSGIVLAKAVPPLDPTPMKQFLASTTGGETHPDGYLRMLAVDMGYMWGRNNSPMLSNRILTQPESLRQLLCSFFQGYYVNVYQRLDYGTRSRLVTLPNYLLQPCQYLLGYL